MLRIRTRMNRMKDYYYHHCTTHADTLGRRYIYYILNPMNVIYRNKGIVFPL